MEAHMLSQIVSLNFVLSKPLHPIYFPFPLAACLHAARTSYAYRSVVKARQAGSPNTSPTFLYDLAGFLIMAWGGGFSVHFILGLVPPQLLSPMPFINYVSIHIFFRLAFDFFGDYMPATNIVDLLMPLFDGVTRSASVFGALLAHSTHTNKAYSDSVFLQQVLGTISTTGGGQLASTFDVFSPQGWSFNTPPFLKSVHFVQFIEFLAPFVATLAFGLATKSHPAYTAAFEYLPEHKPPAAFSVEEARALMTGINRCLLCLEGHHTSFPQSCSVFGESNRQEHPV